MVVDSLPEVWADADFCIRAEWSVTAYLRFGQKGLCYTCGVVGDSLPQVLHDADFVIHAEWSVTAYLRFGQMGTLLYMLIGR